MRQKLLPDSTMIRHPGQLRLTPAIALCLGCLAASFWIVRLASPAAAQDARPADSLAEVESPPGADSPSTQPAERPATSDFGALYRKYFLELEPRDVEGHLWLAYWCIEVEQYGLAARQARYVLKIDEDNEEARRLKHEASNGMARLREIEAAVPDPAIPPDKWDPIKHKEFLSKAEINRLRFAEILPLPLRDLRMVAVESTEPVSPEDAPNAPPRDHLRVHFDETLPEDFLDYMSNHPSFDEDVEKNLFLRLSSDQQLQLIEYYSGNRFADRIEIWNDPWTFRQLRTLLPSILANCASSGCHGGRRAKVFRLRTTRKGSAANVYTNFLILSRLEVGQWPVINRVAPERSLLLEYGLPADEATRPHPVPIRPLFRDGRNDPDYRELLHWIENLRVPRPQTGIELPGYPERSPPGAMIGKPPEEDGTQEDTVPDDRIDDTP